MGISIEQYRSRIGKFLPSLQKKVTSRLSSKNIIRLPSHLVSVVVLAAVLTYCIVNEHSISHEDFKNLSQHECSLVYPISYLQVSSYFELSNFSARYLDGNPSKKQTNGIKIAHLNKDPGFLVTKINDIESKVSSLKPHIPGISEANFRIYFSDVSYCLKCGLWLQ